MRAVTRLDLLVDAEQDSEQRLRALSGFSIVPAGPRPPKSAAAQKLFVFDLRLIVQNDAQQRAVNFHMAAGVVINKQ